MQKLNLIQYYLICEIGILMAPYLTAGFLHRVSGLKMCQTNRSAKETYHDLKRKLASIPAIVEMLKESSFFCFFRVTKPVKVRLEGSVGRSVGARSHMYAHGRVG